jgi:hypothetical protein
VLLFQLNEERLVSLHGDVEASKVHISTLEELLAALVVRVEGVIRNFCASRVGLD